MATVLDRKYTAKDTAQDLCGAILKLAADKNGRLLLTDDVAWKETKLKEIARLARILQKKLRTARA